MADSVAPAGEHDGVDQGKRGDAKPRQGYEEFFRFRPIRFYRFIEAETQTHQSTKDKRNYLTDMLMRRPTRAFFGIAVRVAVPIAIIAVIGVVVWLSYDAADPTDAIIAVFTAVLAIVAIVQWWTTHRQLEHMRAEQRPWLSINKPTVDYWENDGGWVLHYMLHNHGKTPANIACNYFGGVVGPISNNTPADVRAVTTPTLRIHTDATTTIAPGSDSGQVQEFALPSSAASKQAFFDGAVNASFALRIDYTGPDGKLYSTASMLSFRRSGTGWMPAVIGTTEDNYMK